MGQLDLARYLPGDNLFNGMLKLQGTTDSHSAASQTEQLQQWRHYWWSNSSISCCVPPSLMQLSVHISCIPVPTLWLDPFHCSLLTDSFGTIKSCAEVRSIKCQSQTNYTECSHLILLSVTLCRASTLSQSFPLPAPLSMSSRYSWS